MPYNNKFIKSLFISGVVFMILMALLSTVQMISGVDQQQVETGSSGASAQNSQAPTEQETKPTNTPTVRNMNGPRISSTQAPARIQRRAIQSVTPTNAVIAGATNGVTGSSYTFNLSVATGTNPMTYTWSVTDQTIITTSNFLSADSQSYSWSTVGVKTILVTISNATGFTTATHQITMTSPAVPTPVATPTQLPPGTPRGISVDGPTSGDSGITHTFSFEVIPPDTTLPITITFEATDHDPQIITSTSLINLKSFIWNIPGAKTIVVTVANDLGTVTRNYNFTVNDSGIAPSSLSIAGPTTGPITGTHFFTATVSPISTTQPITYVWQATDQTGTTHTGGTLADALSFNWDSIGEKTITVIASNPHGSISNTHQITIEDQPGPEPEGVAPESVTISGISHGEVDTNYTFSASVSPISTTEPITYVWQATGQAAQTTNAETFSVSWNTPGEKSVTVVASNAYGRVTAQHLVTIKQDKVSPLELTITGPTDGELDTHYSFTADVAPISTTQPITYVWQATDQTEVTQFNGTLTGIQSFNWSTRGKKTITVIASNNNGRVTSTHSITIREPIAPQVLTISGPTVGDTASDYVFTATVGPISTTQPLTYTWQATDQSEATQINGTLTDTQSFNWNTPGEKTITVKVENQAGSVTEIHSMRIKVAPTALAIDGAETGYVGRTYPFTATISPPNSNEPITYTWESTDHESLTLFGGTLNDTQFFEWDEPGEKIIVVTAVNNRGTISNTHLITIEEAPPIAVMIEGPDEGDVDTNYNFVATVSRSYTTVPLTYTWETSGQEPVIRSSNALVNIVPLSWTIEAPQMITVTAANHLGAVSDTHLIDIKRPLLGFVMSDSPDPIMVSDTLTYFITVTNNAPVTADEAVLLDELPEDVKFIDAVASQGSCTEEEGDVTCELGTLESGQTATINLTVIPSNNGRIINRANISSSTPELQVDARTIAEDTLVTKPGVGITKVSPNASFNDVPSIVYLDGFGFSEVLSVTLTGTMTDTLTGTLETVLDVRYVDPVLLVAEIPAGLTPGLYDITANTATEQAVVSKGYELKDFADFEDLYALPEWFSTHPRPIRVGEEGSGISLTLEHLGGQDTVENVTVEFQVHAVDEDEDEDEDGEVLGTGTIASLAPSTKGSTNLVSWEPTESKAYTLVAIIDPNNEIEESDELNNVITRTLFVLPEAEDTLPPIINDFLIEDNAQTILDQDVTLDVTARDAEKPSATGVEAIKFIEFEYILGARRWVPIQRSDWVTYQLAEFDYPWKMIPTFGMRYMQAWSVDGAGNISEEAGAEVIDLLPTEQVGYVGQYGVVFYRFKLGEGETFAATLTSVSGDADLHVWGPHGQRWSSNSTGVDNVEFEAPLTATYQIEVHGFEDSNYNLIFGSNGTPSLRRMQGVAPKPLPEEIAVPLGDWPEYYETEGPPPLLDTTLYLPLVMR